ncbi:WD40-repeat-containing domain protein [Suillus americanus]|nr:WD40-repeat-containing domain protein [Suillus americanus]
MNLLAQTMSFFTDTSTPGITPRQTMRGHTDWVNGAVLLPDGGRIITGSSDGSLRLWDIQSGAQIGEEWRDENSGVWSMALSPNGKTIASGSGRGEYSVRLWDVETRKVISKWTGHINVVRTLCWSTDGERVASGSWDGTARVWDVRSGKTILKIKTGHGWVCAVRYSTDSSKLATGGDNVAVKIWDAKTGELLKTLFEHDSCVYSLSWTSDGKKLISGSYLIRIFDTATWQQIAILEGHTSFVSAISLSQNNRLLASASFDKTVHLWNLDTNLPVGPPLGLKHEDELRSAALSPDGKVLVTGCENKNAYTWDVHTILKEAGLEDPLLPIGTNIAPKDRLDGIQHTPRSSLDDTSFLEADATRYPDQFDGVDELPPRFFDGMEGDFDTFPIGGAHPHSSVNALLARLSSLLHRLRPINGEAPELLQPPRLLLFHPHTLLARLSSFIHRPPPENDAPDELQQPSIPSRLDPHVLLAHLSSLLSRSRHGTDEEADPQPATPSISRPDAPTSWLSSVFRSQPHTNEEIELAQRPRHPPVVEVAAVRDKQTLVVARGPQFEKAKRAYERQTQLHGQAQVSSSHTQPADASPSAIPLGSTTVGTVVAQSPPVQWWAWIVLFLCCAHPSHTNGD